MTTAIEVHLWEPCHREADGRWLPARWTGSGYMTCDATFRTEQGCAVFCTLLNAELRETVARILASWSSPVTGKGKSSSPS